MAKYVHVSKIEKKYTQAQGCTCPILVLLANGSKAVLKYPQNPYREVVLVNEYISYNIAGAINLPIPNFGIAEIDTQSTLDNQLPEQYTIDLFCGICFYSEYIPSALKSSFRILQYVKNLQEACKIILFDHIIKNGDRYSSNVIVTPNAAEPKMFIIDHSHAFGDPEWDCSTLHLNDWSSPYIWQENYDLYDMLIRAGAPIRADDLAEASQIIKQHVTQELLDNIVDSIPMEWEEKVGKCNLQYVKEYILSRVNNIDKICEMIMKERGV